jgi:hypothetical protein
MPTGVPSITTRANASRLVLVMVVVTDSDASALHRWPALTVLQLHTNGDTRRRSPSTDPAID